MRKALLAATLLLAACAGLLTDTNDAQNSWRGMRYDDVVAQWGPPTRSAKLTDGRESHTWVSEGTISRMMPSISIFAGNSGGVGAEVSPQPGGSLYRCERTLLFQDGRVVGQTWRGDGDYCSTFVRH